MTTLPSAPLAGGIHSPGAPGSVTDAGGASAASVANAVSATDLPRRARAIYLVGPEEIELREVVVPRPGPGELLVAIEAATTCGTDLKVLRRGGHPRMLEVPGPFGHEMTGRIVAAGRGPSARSGAARFREGDAVVVANSASCGACPACREGRENLCPQLAYLNGAYADFLLVPAHFVTRSTYPRPAGLAPELAALAEPLACVEHGLVRLNLVQRGAAARKVLVQGAGPLGLLFVAVLRELGHLVTAADPHAVRLEVAKKMGADSTIHIERSWNDEYSSIEREYEIAIDATGTVAGWSTALAATLPGGATLFFGGCAPADRIELSTFPIHYDELSLFGSYHHTPRSFQAAIDRLAAARSDYRRLLSYEESLENVEEALRAMIDRRALKVVIRPGYPA
jgi:L-iditol 2-dehydrogenase